MKRTWLVAGSIVTVIAIAFGTSQAVGLLAHEEVTETETFPTDGVERLRVATDSGSIEIEGGDVEEITVVAEISHGFQRTRHQADVEDGTLVVDSDCPIFSQWCSVDYRITVPADVDVVASSSNGRITVRDLTGDVDVDGDNGRVELVRLTGSITASTDNGRLEGTGLRSQHVDVDSDNGRVTLTFAEPPSAVTATSDNGRVEVVVPDTTDTYRVRATTDDGDNDVGVRTDPDSDRTITIDTDNGDVDVRYPTG